jgi:hypothetical protein
MILIGSNSANASNLREILRNAITCGKTPRIAQLSRNIILICMTAIEGFDGINCTIMTFCTHNARLNERISAPSTSREVAWISDRQTRRIPDVR